MNDWTNDIESILENIRINCITLSNYHKEKYYYYKSLLKFFKLPLIILSSICSISSVGLTGYMAQSDISMLTCVLSLISAIIASIELYLGIQKNMENEMNVSRSFQILSYDIYRTLNLSIQNRQVNGKIYLDQKYTEYIKQVEQANLVHNKKVKDVLAPIPEILKLNMTPTNSTSSNFELTNDDENNI